MLIKRNEKVKKLSKPSLETLIGGIKMMDFTSHSSFKINHVIDKKEISLLFQRTGIDWKITQIEFPDDLFEDFKNSNLEKIQNLFKDKKKPKNILSKDIEKIQKHIRKCCNTSHGFNELKGNVIKM